VSYVIAIANQKGGVGKTTSAVNISSELAKQGRSVLLIDFDPQGSATSGIGATLPEEGKDLFDVFMGNLSLKDILQDTAIRGLTVAPASRDLVSLEIEVGKKPGRELILKEELTDLVDYYDYVIIDCPPSSGLLTLNALGASQYVLIPLQTEYYALEGISALMNTLQFVQATYNPNLQILGVFSTMFDSRTKLSFQVEDEAKSFFGDKMFSSRVPRNVKLSEAPSHGVPIGVYDPTSIGAKSYREVTNEIIARLESNTTEHGDDDLSVANG
jgi:chromosome partitioning protein